MSVPLYDTKERFIFEIIIAESKKTPPMQCTEDAVVGTIGLEPMTLCL